MANQAELKAKLTLDTAEFKQNLQQSLSNIESFTKTIRNLNIIEDVVKVLGSAFHELTSTISEVTKGVSELVHSADKLGVGVPALEALHYAAQQAGVSTDALDNSIKFLEKNIGNAALGIGNSSKYFDLLGLSAAKLQNLSVDKQMIAISDAIKGVQDPTERMAIAIGIMGKGAAATLGLLRGNVKGLVNEFEGLGVSLSDQQARSLTSYGESLKKLDTLWEGFKNQLAATLAGPMKNMLEWITKSIVGWGGVKEAAVSAAGGIIDGLGLAVDAMQYFTGLQDEVIKNFYRYEIIALRAVQNDNFGTASLKTKIALGGQIYAISEKINALDKKRDAGQLGGIQQKLKELKASLESAPVNSSLAQVLPIQETITSEYDKQILKNIELNKLADERLKTFESVNSVLKGFNDTEKQIQAKEKEIKGLKDSTFQRTYDPNVDNRIGVLEAEITDLRVSTGLNSVNELTLSNLNRQVADRPEFQATNILANKLGQLGEALNKLSDPSSQQNVRTQVDVKIEASSDFIATVVNSQDNVKVIDSEIRSQMNEVARGEQS